MQRYFAASTIDFILCYVRDSTNGTYEIWNDYRYDINERSSARDFLLVIIL